MADTLEAIVDQCVSGLGLDLEAVELTSGGKKRLLRVAVDQDGGVGIDDIATATRELSEVLDAGDVMGDAPYTLEVTSRGVDRPLTAPRHWRRNPDRLVRVRLTDDETVLEGRIGDSDDTGVDLLSRAATRRLAYSDIDSAIIQVELTPPSHHREDS